MNEFIFQPDNSYLARLSRIFDVGYQFKGIGIIMFFIPLLILLGIFFLIKHYARNKKIACVFLIIAMIAYVVYAFCFLPGFFYLYTIGPL